MRIVVKGRPDYNRWTLHQWILEVKDLLEEEYNVEIDVEVMNTSDDLPVLSINDVDVWIGLPGEEGYLIEIIKKFLEEKLGFKRSYD